MTEPTRYWPFNREADANLCASEANRILPGDIASYTYPPGRRERYTDGGWEKAKALGIAELDVRDFGALPDQPAGKPHAD